MGWEIKVYWVGPKSYGPYGGQEILGRADHSNSTWCMAL